MEPTYGQVDLFLVSCVELKANTPCSAKEHYRSQWFRMAKRHVERSGQPWFVLSAHYGLLHPDDIVAPYNMRIDWLAHREYVRWGKKVIEDLKARFGSLEGKTACVFAGHKYMQTLRDPAERSGLNFVRPLTGLRIGQQLAWFSAQQRLAEGVCEEVAS